MSRDSSTFPAAEPPSGASSPLSATARVQLAALATLAVVLVALLLSGIFLWFEYRPHVTSGDPGQAVPLSFRVQTVHRWAGHISVALTLLVFGLSVAVGLERRRHQAGRRGWVLSGAAVATVAGLWFGGWELAWDQLAIWAVEVGIALGRLDGVVAVFDEDVRFALVDGVETSVSAYRRWAIVHAVVLPAVLVGLLGVLARQTARRRRAR